MQSIETKLKKVKELLESSLEASSRLIKIYEDGGTIDFLSDDSLLMEANCGEIELIVENDFTEEENNCLVDHDSNAFKVFQEVEALAFQLAVRTLIVKSYQNEEG